MSAFMEDFINGFEKAAPEGYSSDEDCSGGNPRPWCCPWLWERAEEWFCPEISAYEMGKTFAEKIYDDLETELEKEE